MIKGPRLEDRAGPRGAELRGPGGTEAEADVALLRRGVYRGLGFRVYRVQGLGV